MNDLDLIQGIWQLVAGERHGTAFPEALVKQVTLIFEGNSLTTRNGDRANSSTFTLDSTASPKAIDLDQGGQPGRGIYELNGDDLRILHGEVGTPRPPSFAIPPGSALTLLTLRRQAANRP